MDHFLEKRVCVALALGFVSVLAPVWVQNAGAQPISFGKSLLAGTSSSNPTSLQFGPDGLLYVAQQDGLIKVYEVVRNAANDYSVITIETITLIRSIPNHNDDGTTAGAPTNSRLVTGLLVTGTPITPVLYVSSSDPRIGGGGAATDTFLDTNSGMVTRLTWNGIGWDQLDLVRGLPRSEENHASNGMQLDEMNNILYLAQGGHTNQGAPSNNLVFLPEYALSAAILSIDLAAIGETTYDIPTLDDEDRAGDPDAGDPFGGNDGKNQAIIVPGAPVQVHSPGWRNAYDIVITQAGRMYTVDNGPNAGWGAVPLNEGPAGNCTNDVQEPGSTFQDNLHFVSGPGYYGGHPNPTRANMSNTFNPTNPQSPVSSNNAVECDYRQPGVDDGAIATFGGSTNGITEYTASNFGGAMQGNLLMVSFSNQIFRTVLNTAGDDGTTTTLFSTVGSNPLDITTHGGSGPFPGVIWVANHGSDQITIYEPDDFIFGCSVDSDCNDSNDCTDDVCALGICQNQNLPNGTGCNDGVACTGSDTCTAGVCAGTDNCPVGQTCDIPSGVCIATGPDVDGDGFSPPADCDDNDNTVFPGAPELCDGKDNDCDTVIDEGNPGGGAICSTGQPGVCAAGTEQCTGGTIQCVADNGPSTEVCDGLDNDCDGAVDEGNPGGGGSCSTGVPGICSNGTQTCQGGALLCVADNSPSPEVCDGLDNDCDGAVDEGNPGGGAQCGVSDVGGCQLGIEECLGGTVQCIGGIGPAAEVCDGIDNDCDGIVDEGNPGGGAACTTGQPGICDAGTEICQGGALTCMANNSPGTEVCDGLDNDCDGSVDDGNPDGGAACTTGQPGICSSGTVQCTGGLLECEPTATAQPELCNGADDDCDGQTDEGNPGSGAACSTGQGGVCDAGTEQCVAGLLQCVAEMAAGAEICATGADEDCDGEVDEPTDCVLCKAEDTIELDTQTKRNTIKLQTVANRDKLVAKGTFFQPSAGFSQPDLDEIVMRVTDEVGGFYEGTLTSGSFVKASNGRKFSYKDKTKPFENDGLKQARFRSKSDLVTTKYSFKAQELELPVFVGTASTVTIKIGNTCYVDSADTCATSPSGKAVRCR